MPELQKLREKVRRQRQELKIYEETLKNILYHISKDDLVSICAAVLQCEEDAEILRNSRKAKKKR